MFESIIKNAVSVKMNQSQIWSLIRSLKRIIMVSYPFGSSSLFEAIVHNLKPLEQKYNSLSEREQKNINNLIVLSISELENFTKLFQRLPNNLKIKTNIDKIIKQQFPSLYDLASKKI